jgi:predicted nucleotidyltransferase
MDQNNFGKEFLQTQLERFSKTQPFIEEIIEKFEKEYDITIFYASETGSRGLGIDVEESDFDITGFFIPKEEEYYKIIRKYDHMIKIVQYKLELDNKIFDVDLELWDIKDWFKAKVKKNNTGCDFWFESPVVYRNLFPDLVTKIRDYVSPPYLLYWGKAKSGIGYNQKDLKNKGECLNKSLMNVLTSLFQYLHSQIYMNFPHYNILYELEFLKNEKEKILSEKHLTNEQLDIVYKNIDFYSKLFEGKKIQRKATSTSIPDCITEFMHFLESNYNTKKRKFELEILLKEDKAQELFEELLHRTKIIK